MLALKTADVDCGSANGVAIHSEKINLEYLGDVTASRISEARRLAGEQWGKHQRYDIRAIARKTNAQTTPKTT